MVGTKCVHVSESTSLDKEHPLETFVSESTLVLVGPNLGEWQAVQKRKEIRGR